uniref:SWIM-type domain-containing protein n=1 Tax=Macrostomum lignano TaxID=282301 RepID=A0A1I8FSL3_9PLAT
KDCSSRNSHPSLQEAQGLSRVILESPTGWNGKKCVPKSRKVIKKIRCLKGVCKRRKTTKRYPCPVKCPKTQTIIRPCKKGRKFSVKSIISYTVRRACVHSQGQVHSEVRQTSSARSRSAVQNASARSSLQAASAASGPSVANTLHTSTRSRRFYRNVRGTCVIYKRETIARDFFAVCTKRVTKSGVPCFHIVCDEAKKVKLTKWRRKHRTVKHYPCPVVWPEEVARPSSELRGGKGRKYRTLTIATSTVKKRCSGPYLHTALHPQADPLSRVVSEAATSLQEAAASLESAPLQDCVREEAQAVSQEAVQEAQVPIPAIATTPPSVCTTSEPSQRSTALAVHGRCVWRRKSVRRVRCSGCSSTRFTTTRRRSGSKCKAGRTQTFLNFYESRKYKTGWCKCNRKPLLLLDKKCRKGYRKLTKVVFIDRGGKQTVTKKKCKIIKIHCDPAMIVKKCTKHALTDWFPANQLQAGRRKVPQTPRTRIVKKQQPCPPRRCPKAKTIRTKCKPGVVKRVTTHIFYTSQCQVYKVEAASLHAALHQEGEALGCFRARKSSARRTRTTTPTVPEVEDDYQQLHEGSQAQGHHYDFLLCKKKPIVCRQVCTKRVTKSGVPCIHIVCDEGQEGQAYQVRRGRRPSSELRAARAGSTRTLTIATSTVKKRCSGRICTLHCIRKLIHSPRVVSESRHIAAGSHERCTRDARLGTSTPTPTTYYYKKKKVCTGLVVPPSRTCSKVADLTPILAKESRFVQAHRSQDGRISDWRSRCCCHFNSTRPKLVFNLDKYKTKSQVLAAMSKLPRDEGITMTYAAIDLSQAELKGISSKGRFWRAGNFNKLDSIVSSVVREVCTDMGKSKSKSGGKRVCKIICVKKAQDFCKEDLQEGLLEQDSHPSLQEAQGLSRVYSSHLPVERKEMRSQEPEGHQKIRCPPRTCPKAKIIRKECKPGRAKSRSAVPCKKIKCKGDKDHVTKCGGSRRYRVVVTIKYIQVKGVCKRRKTTKRYPCPGQVPKDSDHHKALQKGS